LTLQPGTPQSASKFSGASCCRPSGRIFDPRITLQKVTLPAPTRRRITRILSGRGPMIATSPQYSTSLPAASHLPAPSRQAAKSCDTPAPQGTSLRVVVAAEEVVRTVRRDALEVIGDGRKPRVPAVLVVERTGAEKVQLRPVEGVAVDLPMIELDGADRLIGREPLAPHQADKPRVITGHMDFLQVRNGAVHILDYKPDARKNKPIAQLGIYALALTRRVPGLKLFDIKSAWFNEEEYCEIFPRTLFARHQ
jgi:hypothetical protein